MKKTPAKRHTREMRAEYDFSGGIRGKYAAACLQSWKMPGIS